MVYATTCRALTFTCACSGTWQPPAARAAGGAAIVREATTANTSVTRAMTVRTRARCSSRALDELRVQRHAAVDEQRRADHVLGVGRGEPRDRGGDLLRRAEAPPGHLLLH